MLFDDEADLRGRERFHGIRAVDLEAELEGALLTVSGMARTSTGRYLRAAVPTQAKSEARGMLDESGAPKRSCGLSGVLCAHRHGATCPGRWASRRTYDETWSRVHAAYARIPAQK